MASPTAPATDHLIDRWPTLSTAEQVQLFHQIPHSEADDFFLSLSAHDQAQLVLALPEGEHRLWLRLLPPDDAVDLIQQLPDDFRTHFLAELDETTRSEVRALLAYKEDQAGGRMSPRFARLRPEMTVDE